MIIIILEVIFQSLSFIGMTMYKNNISVAAVLVSFFLYSCGSFREASRTYSPDNSKYLLRYYFIEVPWAAGAHLSLSVLNSTQPIRHSNKYRLIPGERNSYKHSYIDAVYWKDNDTLIAVENFMEFKRRGKSVFKESIFSLNGVIVKVELSKDPIDSTYERNIVYREISPDRQKELVVYTYVNPGKYYNYFNISVINVNDTVPKYGNFYILTYSSIGVCNPDIGWDSTGILNFRLPKNVLVIDGSIEKDFVCSQRFNESGLVESRPGIKYTVAGSRKPIY